MGETASLKMLGRLVEQALGINVLPSPAVISSRLVLVISKEFTRVCEPCPRQLGRSRKQSEIVEEEGLFNGVNSYQYSTHM
jgi:hypothetical protein